MVLSQNMGIEDANLAGFVHGGVVVLVRELRRVHADHHQVVAELLLELAELGEHVDAVDAPLRPEVEEHDAAAQRRERERARGADEAARALELGRPHARGRRHFGEGTRPNGWSVRV